MSLSKTAALSALFVLIVSGASFAQTTPSPTPTDKQAISKQCSDQADAQKLRGKERKKFRSACKRHGGKPA